MTDSIRTDRNTVLRYHVAPMTGTPSWQCLTCNVYIVTWDDTDELKAHVCDGTEDCKLCADPSFPVPHFGSSFCQSGKRPHCTCDYCW